MKTLAHTQTFERTVEVQITDEDYAVLDRPDDPRYAQVAALVEVLARPELPRTPLELMETIVTNDRGDELISY